VQARLAAQIFLLCYALGHLELTRSAPAGVDEDFYTQDQVRRRSIRLLLAAGRASREPQELQGPPDVVLEGAVQRLEAVERLWVKSEPSMRQLFTRGRELIIDRVNVDVLLVVATEIEFRKLHAEFEARGMEGRPDPGKTNTYWKFDAPNGTCVALVRCSMGSNGPGGSNLSVKDAIDELHPDSVVGLGIAFGIDPEEQPIGQLLLSERVTAYDSAKIGSRPDGALEITPRAPSPPASPRLISRFRDYRLDKIGIQLLPGVLLSGEKVIDNGEFKALLLKHFPEAIGGEMEGTGIAAACIREKVDWVIAKAVCDYAEAKAEDKAARQAKAAEVAARAVVHLVAAGAFLTSKD
jgi:nucleoside phosphorylase